MTLINELKGLRKERDQMEDDLLKRVLKIGHGVSKNENRIKDFDRFVLSQPGKLCPLGYKPVTDRNQCKLFVHHIRKHGFASHGHEFVDFNNTSWGDQPHGCFMWPDEHDRVHFNNSTAASHPNPRSLRVCARK